MAPVTPNIDIFCFVVTMIFNTLVVFVSKEGICYICISLRPPYAKAGRRCRHIATCFRRPSRRLRTRRHHYSDRSANAKGDDSRKATNVSFPTREVVLLLLFSAKEEEERVWHNHLLFFNSYFLPNRLPLRPDFSLGVTGTELPKVVVVPKVVVDALPVLP